MHTNRIPRFVSGGLLSALLCGAGYGADQALVLRDYTGRGFPPDLVNYTANVSAKEAGRLRLAGPDGKPVALQTTIPEKGAATLSFVAELPANGNVTYTLKNDGQGDVPATPVKVTKEKDALVLENGLLSVRVPRETSESFAKPVAATTLPAPILGFRSGGSPRLGAGRILSTNLIKALTVKLAAAGPAYSEVLYELQFADGGYYRASIQVIDRVPLAKVREDYDLKRLDGTQFWELDLGRGWKPDRAQTAAHNGNGGGDPTGRDVDFAGLMAGQPAQYMVGDQAWGKLSHLGIYNQADSKAASNAFTMVGVVPLRKGLWRRSNAMEVLSGGANDITVRFPMGVRHAEWGKDITSETSPFSTQEHEMALPKTYGCRVWGLALGQPSIPDPQGNRPFYQLQRIYGIVGLDRYKDFILDWPFDAAQGKPDAKSTYPRLYGSRASAAKGDSLPALRQSCLYYFTSPHASHHGTCVNYLIAANADADLAKPDLSTDARREIRARLALLTYMYEDADMMSYANGHHHGNPNMGTARFWSGPCFMTLLPDHPMFARWRDHMALYGAYNIGTQVAPGGGYFEYGAAYHMHGFARAGNGVPALRSAGAANAAQLLGNYVGPDWRYYMNLLTPNDSRWRSRMIPGMANSQPGNTEHFIEASGCLAGSDPALASNLAWAWQANGSKSGANVALAALAAAPVEPALTSQIYPGVGVVFRAHQGPQETYMLFRCGFQWSHWTVDPGHFVLFSKGAVLAPYQPFQYGDSSDPSFDLQNTIRFGHPENVWPHGWGDSTVLDHTFGKSVDYAWGLTGFPDWFVKPGVAPTWANAANVTAAGARKLDNTPQQIEGAFDWNRQVLFMKGKTATSPNYFVIRDSMPGGGKLASYLYLNLLGTKKDVKPEGGRISVDTEWPTKLDVLFAQPSAVAPDMSEQRLPMALHNSNLGDRVGAPGTVSPNWVKKDGSPWEGAPAANQTYENHVVLRIPGAPGTGYFWVLYPRGKDEPAPKVSALAEGVMKVEHPEGMDYVFLGASPIAYDGEGVVFNGRAGAIRVDSTSVVLVKGKGEGRVGYKGRIVTGTASCEKSFALAALAAGIENAGAAGQIELPAMAATEKELAPGILSGTLDNGITRYRLTGPASASFKNDAVRLEGGPAAIDVSAGSVRFVVASDSYVKLSVGNRGVRGVGPFDLTFTDTGITGTVDGDTRSIVATWPQGIVRPMFHMDGIRYYAGWADDHSIGKGTDAPQFSIGFGVTDGKHQVEISEWTYPVLPPSPSRIALKF